MAFLRLFLTFVLCTSTVPVVFSQDALPWAVEFCKKFTGAVTAKDSTASGIYVSQGTGAFLKHNNLGFFLTNEHVIALKDTNNKTIRYLKDISVSLNVKSLGAINCQGNILYANETMDLAMLQVRCPSSIMDSMEVSLLSSQLWWGADSLKEGQTIIYTGYPLNLGRGHFNHPLSRTGIIAQLIPGNRTFLIDAFVQKGYSGSPVFVLEKKSLLKTRIRFVGIASAYPGRFTPLLKKVKYSAIQNFGINENPGFAYVIGVETVFKFIEASKLVTRN